MAKEAPWASDVDCVHRKVHPGPSCRDASIAPRVQKAGDCGGMLEGGRGTDVVGYGWRNTALAAVGVSANGRRNASACVREESHAECALTGCGGGEKERNAPGGLPTPGHQEEMEVEGDDAGREQKRYRSLVGKGALKEECEETRWHLAQRPYRRLEVDQK